MPQAQPTERIGSVKLTLPTVPMALTYVQLLAREFSLDQHYFQDGSSKAAYRRWIHALVERLYRLRISIAFQHFHSQILP